MLVVVGWRVGEQLSAGNMMLTVRCSSICPSVTQCETNYTRVVRSESPGCSFSLLLFFFKHKHQQPHYDGAPRGEREVMAPPMG